MPTAAITAGSPWCARISSGRPTPAIITGKAAKALPITIVNKVIPTA